MTFSQAFFSTFGVSPFAVAAFATLHFHLFIVGRRATKLESLPTNARELRALTLLKGGRNHE
jgi:3-keto-L-gulonate-6-phosphate decarboxylase